MGAAPTLVYNIPEQSAGWSVSESIIWRSATIWGTCGFCHYNHPHDTQYHLLQKWLLSWYQIKILKPSNPNLAKFPKICKCFLLFRVMRRKTHKQVTIKMEDKVGKIKTFIRLNRKRGIHLDLLIFFFNMNDERKRHLYVFYNKISSFDCIKNSLPQT